MARFKYNGRTIDGKILSGYAHATSQEVLEKQLLQKGIFLQEAQPHYSALHQWYIKTSQRSEITRLTRQFQILVDSGIGIIESLELIAEQTRSATLRTVFEQIVKHVQEGETLAESLAQYPLLFDQLYISMVEAGESSGQLEMTLDQISSYRERNDMVTSKIRSALAYPLLVLCVAALVMFILIIYIVPVFSSMYSNFGAELPMLTQKVIAVSGFLRETVWYWVGGLFVTTPVIILLSLTHRAKFVLHRLLVTVPIFKPMVVRIISARFSRTLGALLAAGVEIVYSLGIASRTTDNLFIQAKIDPLQELIVSGQSLTESLTSSNLFPKAMLRMVAAGEQTGRLGEMLLRSAEYFERQVETDTTTLTSLVEPIIILILGIFIAFMLVAMYLPMFELVGTL